MNPKLRVLAVDDEPLALRQLAAYIQRVESLELVAACHSAVEARVRLSEEPADAIFCDINMPDLNGLDFVRQLASPPLVVFTTAYSEYAIEGFRVDAVDYLLKPYSFNEFKTSAERLCQRHELILKAASAEKEAAEPPAGGVIYVRSDHRNLSIPIAHIARVQAMGEYLRIFLTNQPRPVMTLMSMKRMEEALPDSHFKRVHRSHIINLSCIAEVAKGRVVLTDGSEVPIGDNYRADFSVWLEQQKP